MRIEGPPARKWPTAGLGAFDNQVDGRRKASPALLFLIELAAAIGGEAIELGLAACVAFGPGGGDPALLLEAMESGIEGALLDLEDFVGELLYALGDGPAVLGLERDGLEDQQVESALDEVAWLSHTVIIYT